MARLDADQIKKRMEKSLTKDKVLKRKVEKQKQKEIYEEKWYKDELKKRTEELEEVSAVQKEVKETKGEKEVKAKNALPTFYDGLDVNTLFNPINLIRSDDKTLRIKFEQYKTNEKLFEPALIGVENEINLQDELSEFYSKIFSDDENYQRLLAQRKEVAKRLREAKLSRIEQEELKKKFDLDVSEIDELNSEKEREVLEKIVQEYEEQGFTREDLDLILDEEVPTINNSVVWEKLGEFRTNFFNKVSSFFQRFIPVYDKYTCTCCGKAKELNEYYIYYSFVNISRTDYHGNVRLSICKDCCEKLFNYLYLEESCKDIEVAMKKWCAHLNIYYDSDIVIQAIRNFNVKEHENHFVKEYLDLIYLKEENIEKSFLDSKFLYQIFDTIIPDSGHEDIADEVKKSEPMVWTKEDIRNKKQVIRMIGYDPFEYQTDENRVILYNDLLNMLESGMENDMVKVQAAIQIVLSYFKIREMNKEEFEMRKNSNTSLADLKKLGEIKAQELNAISKFSADNGFSERWATAKAKGDNTFTGTMKRMLEDKFEDVLINKFDIETSATIQQAAEASITAMFKQLNMSTAEYGVLMGKQLKRIEDLTKENNSLQEEIRKLKIKKKEEELIEEAKELGVYENLEEDLDEEEY